MSDSENTAVEEQAVLTFEHKGDSDTEVDMTPMIDCVFLLLIFFVVTASFQMQKALEVPPPEQPSESPQPDLPEDDADKITVRIDSDNTIWVNDSRATSEQDLLIKLRSARERAKDLTPDGRPAHILEVKADGDATHEVVIMVLDAGNAVGMEKLRMKPADDF